MFRFLKINPETLYTHITQEELKAIGIDLANHSRQTENRILEMVAKSLEEQDEIDLSKPISVQVSVANGGMQILVTEFHLNEGHAVPPAIWDDVTEEMLEEMLEEMMEVDVFQTDYVFQFRDVEDLLLLVRRFPHDVAETILSDLYLYESHYYLFLYFFQAEDIGEIKDTLSLIEEFGGRVSVTAYVLDEYGKKLLEDTAIEELYDYFF